MVSLGVTGIAGSGKSLLCRFFEKDGALVSDLDSYAHSLYENSRGPVFAEVIERFNARVPDLVSSEGTLDRKALGRFVFSDESALSELNAIFFPRFRSHVAETADAARASGRTAYVLDAAVLFECGLESLLDATVWVDAPDSLLADRLVKKRGWTMDYSEKVVKAQRIKYSSYSKLATWRIINDSNENEFHEKYLLLKKEIFK